MLIQRGFRLAASFAKKIQKSARDAKMAIKILIWLAAAALVTFVTFTLVNAIFGYTAAVVACVLLWFIQ